MMITYCGTVILTGRIEANIIKLIRYLFPHWLSTTDPSYDDLIILHILWTNSIAFIVSHTLLTLYYQVKLTWVSGRRLTASMSRTVKQIKYQLLIINCFFSN